MIGQSAEWPSGCEYFAASTAHTDGTVIAACVDTKNKAALCSMWKKFTEVGFGPQSYN